MITSKQLEETAHEEYARVSILRKVWTFIDGFKSGAIWAEKTIRDEFYKSFQGLAEEYTDNEIVAYQKIKELEAKLLNVNIMYQAASDAGISLTSKLTIATEQIDIMKKALEKIESPSMVWSTEARNIAEEALAKINAANKEGV